MSANSAAASDQTPSVKIRPGVARAVGVGLALRVAWLVASRPRLGGYSTDEASYVRIADDLGNGWLPSIGGHPTAFFSPGYPGLLALPTKIGGWLGHTPLAVALTVNLVLAAVTIVLIGSLVRRCGGSETVGSWMWALYPGSILMGAHAMAENLFVAIAAGALLAISHLAGAGPDRGPEGQRWRTSQLFLLGALAGLGVLVRSSGVGLAAIAVVAVVLANIDRPSGPTAEARSLPGFIANVRRPLASAAWCAAGIVTVCLPWTVRNQIDVGLATPLPTNNLTALCAGNWEEATGAWVESPVMLERCLRHSPWDNPEIIAPLDRPAGFEMSYPDERLWYRTVSERTLDWIAANPARQPGLVAERAQRALLSDFDPHYEPAAWATDHPTALAVTRTVANLAYWLLVGAAGFGWYLNWPNRTGRRMRRLLLAAVAATTLPSLIGVAYPMFKFPAMVPLVALAALSTRSGTQTGRDWVQRIRRR